MFDSFYWGKKVFEAALKKFNNQLKTCKMEYSGIDKSIEISLFEYGLLVEKTDELEKNVIYKFGEKYCYGSISENELNQLLKGEDWINSIDLCGFFDYIGSEDINEYLNRSIETKLYDLISYFGSINILGTPSFCYSEDAIRELLEIY